MQQEFYSMSRFAASGCVTVRTLRYFDRVGLLSPSARTTAGHRQYTSADLARQQQVLALKLPGFSLSESSHCLRFGPASLHSALRLQKAIRQKRRSTLDQILAAPGYGASARQDSCKKWQVGGENA